MRIQLIENLSSAEQSENTTCDEEDVICVLKSLEKNVVYFQSPSEIKILPEIEKKKIRVGGMVKKSSIFVKEQKSSL